MIMVENINIVEILKDKPQGTKLYSSACGKCKLEEVDDKSFKISFYNSKFGFMNGGEGYLDKNGKLYDDGECVVFPSKEMRDWRKFAWEKGDVLVNKNNNSHIIFDKFNNDTYTTFTGKLFYQVVKAGYNYTHTCCNVMTQDYDIEEGDAAQTYINAIEERLGGKLNRETLEVEKPKKKKPKKKPVFELGNLYVFNEDDEDGELTIIGKLIGKNEIEDTLTFGNQYEIGNEKFVADQAFDLRISIHEELREATEGEAITFHEAYTIWEKSKKQSAFKPFDKVLVRDSESDKWRANLFGYIDNGEYYHCVFANWVYCIPYNEETAHLLGTTDEWKGGEQ